MWQSKYFILFLLLIIHTNPDTKTYLTSDILIDMNGKEDKKLEKNKLEKSDSFPPGTKVLLEEQISLQKKQLEQGNQMIEAIKKNTAAQEKKSSWGGFWSR